VSRHCQSGFVSSYRFRLPPVQLHCCRKARPGLQTGERPPSGPGHLTPGKSPRSVHSNTGTNQDRLGMKILIVYYSLYGHVLKMARAVEEGARSVAGAEVVLRRAEEFEIVQQKTANDPHINKVRESQKDVPVCTLDDLRAADAVIFGSPTRYGNMTAQMKQLIDSTGSLWLKGDMEGKPAGVFTSTASTHGGQETTLLTMMVPLIHLGMLIVGVPYSTPGMIHTEARGGTPYGATTIAGAQGELQPAEGDFAIARVLGKRVAEVAKKLRT
jgi:NAD(P)H dehydrogenase (quinone)